MVTRVSLRRDRARPGALSEGGPGQLMEARVLEERDMSRLVSRGSVEQPVHRPSRRHSAAWPSGPARDSPTTVRLAGVQVADVGPTLLPYGACRILDAALHRSGVTGVTGEIGVTGASTSARKAHRVTYQYTACHCRKSRGNGRHEIPVPFRHGIAASVRRRW